MANPKGSRYKNLTFYPPEGGRPAFPGIRPRTIGSAVGILEHIVKENERLDLLALYYYNNPRRWWRIVDANPDVMYGGDLVITSKVGTVILIPRANEPGEKR
jgi:hypothetical protein